MLFYILYLNSIIISMVELFCFQKWSGDKDNTLA